MDIDTVMGRAVEIINASEPTKRAVYSAGGAEATWATAGATVALVCDVVFASGKPRARVQLHGSCSYLSRNAAKDFHRLYGRVLDVAALVESHIAQTDLA